MAIPVLIYGKSGSGKSRSMKFFGEDEAMIINIEGKSFPFRNKFKWVGKTDSIDQIINQFCKMPCKVGIIDDAGYLQTHIFMNQHRNKKGNSQFDMYDNIADLMYTLIKDIKDKVPDDKVIYIMMHEDVSDSGETKLRTLGKLLDNKVCLEGMVTICLRCMSEAGKHYFRTVTDGFDITKAPEEMFAEPMIDNNLKLVDETIREFYGL